MAHCPECGRNDSMTLDKTGRTVLVDMGPAFIAGQGYKRAARNQEVFILKCAVEDPWLGCGWSTEAYVDLAGEYLIPIKVNETKGL